MNQNQYGSGQVAGPRSASPATPRQGVIARFPPQLTKLAQRLETALNSMAEELVRVAGPPEAPAPSSAHQQVVRPGGPIGPSDPDTLAGKFESVDEHLATLADRADFLLTRLQDI